MNRAKKIEQAFDQAALRYDSHADVQAEVARLLAKLLVAREDKPTSVLELGCGTGFLTEHLLKAFPDVEYHATDIAPSMLAVTKEKLKTYSHLTTGYLDANDPVLDQKYDWIVSSLTFQWLDDLLQSLRTLSDKTNLIAFSTLVEGTFQEWHDLCRKYQHPVRTLPFLTDDQLKQQTTLSGWKTEIISQTIQKEYPSPRDFVRSLKAIGAGTSSAHKEGSEMSQQLWKKEKTSFSVSYQSASVFID